jgi:hypothetical protein
MGLRDRLRERSRPSAVFVLRVEDDTAARAELATALAEDGDVTAAQAAVDSCHERLTITALPPADMEALIAAHPPTAEQETTNSAWNPVTFIPALFAASIGGDVSEEDWAEYTTKGPMTSGEVRALVDVCLDVNYRAPNPSPGKG